MVKANKEMMRKWVENWKRTGIALEKIRREEIRQANTRRAIENLDDAFNSVLLHFRPRPSSGLVEQQRLFHQRKS